MTGYVNELDMFSGYRIRSFGSIKRCIIGPCMGADSLAVYGVQVKQTKELVGTQLFHNRPTHFCVFLLQEVFLEYFRASN